jgi:hypothetical protein
MQFGIEPRALPVRLHARHHAQAQKSWCKNATAFLAIKHSSNLMFYPAAHSTARNRSLVSPLR